MDLSSGAVMKAIMQTRGIRPQHKLGQNFLTDARVLDAIVAAGEVDPQDFVLEIGPGLGALTQRLARAAGRVLAIELDRALVQILQETLVKEMPNLEVLQADAARIDLKALLADRLMPGQKAKVLANLPYYITTPLVMRLLEEKLPLAYIVVMVQKEVADRMISPPGSKEYGALSVAVQYYTEPRIITKVSRGAFLPPPDVDSAVVAMQVRSVPPVDAPPDLFFRVVRAAFGQRRKVLLNALAAGLGTDKQRIQQALDLARVDGSRRGETLSQEEFAAIARGLVNIGDITGNAPEKGVTDKV